MPYKSNQQHKFFHTEKAKEMGIKPETIKEFDESSKGLKLPKFSNIKKKLSKG